MAFQISLNSRTSKIVREYNDGIFLNGPYEVGLKHFTVWNSLYNVTTKNNIIVFKYFSDNHFVSETYTFPPGYYEIDEIIEKIQNDEHIKQSETTISLSKHSFKISIRSKWEIDFDSEHSLGRLLGFSKQKIKPNTTAISDMPVDIFSINNIKVCCNLIQSNIEDLKRNVNTLYDFPLDSNSFGAKIIKEPNPICYFTVNTDKIYELLVTITDQDNNIIDFHGELISLTLDFRPIKNG